MRMRTSIVLAVLGTSLVACDPSPTAGSAGPPEILQVFARERVMTTDDDGNDVVLIEPRLAFGDHPDIPKDEDDRQVTAAVARDGQRIRIVVDELLLGNALEEVPCADGSWSKVPVGMDFDGVARCAGADLSRCEGLCIGPNGPIGILDANQDGAIDDTRMIEGAVTLTCDGAAVPLDPQRSYYQPSGTQLIPGGSVDALGPAVVIAAADGMPPGSHCAIAFAESIVDKQGERICAPTAAGCTPGDTSAIGFTVEPFTLATSEPAHGATDVALTAPMSDDATITIHWNAALDPDSVAPSVTVTADGVAVDGLAPTMSPDDAAAIDIAVPGGFKPATTYEVTVTGGAAGIKDAFADTLDGDATITWTTK
jgi:hypothetical protein